MKTYPTIHVTSNIAKAIFSMPNITASLETKRPSTTLPPADTAFGELQHMQLPSVKPQRHNDKQFCIVRLNMTASIPISQTPRINTVCIKRLSQFPVCFLQPAGFPQLLCLPTFLGVHLPEFGQFRAKPSFAYFKRCERPIPAFLTGFRSSFNVFNHESSYWKKCCQPSGYS